MFFFFQAEDGIRDIGVTGVQTCALPISAMLMATKAALPPSLLTISGTIPLSQTIFLWPSLVTTTILIGVAVSVAYLSAPSMGSARTAEDYGIPTTLKVEEVGRPARPGEWLEYSPILS